MDAVLAWIGNHPILAGAVVFAVAFLDALIVVGAVVPALPLLFAVGVLIGMGAIVMDGAVIEDDVVLGAGSLVPPGKTLHSGYLYVGSPVKQARPLSEKEKAFFTYSAANYVRLKDSYLAEG